MKKILGLLLVVASLNCAHAGWLTSLLGTTSTNTVAATNAASPTATSSALAALAGLSQDQMVGGLKAVLTNGLQHAVASLGHDGGFLTNVEVKIPLPDKLQSVDKALRAVNQGKLADEFVATMNHAAEQAVPVAATVFVNAMAQMTIADAQAILTGPPDAATQYFRRTTQTNLYAKFYPIVQKATSATGVTSAYKNMLAKATGTSSGFGSTLSGLAGNYLGTDALDVDAYVTNKALDGLFKMVADEEKQIRQNPVARTTDLLKQVFGAVGK